MGKRSRMDRKLSCEFMKDLKKGGRLYPLLKKVVEDKDLMLAIRKDYINIYYRDGNIIKLRRTSKNQYKASFDAKYARDCQESLPEFLRETTASGRSVEHLITPEKTIEDWIENIPCKKKVMDSWFEKNKRLEREFQQSVVYENNCLIISDKTTYFIVDIELAGTGSVGARFDMLAFKWPAKDRKCESGKVQLSLIEIKYGKSALRGDSGVIEHFKKIFEYLKDNHADNLKKNRTDIAKMATEQINQFSELGLFRHTEETALNFEVDIDNFEVVFLFAERKSRPIRFLKVLEDLKDSEEFKCNTANKVFDLRFFDTDKYGLIMCQERMMNIDGYMDFLRNCKDLK